MDRPLVAGVRARVAGVLSSHEEGSLLKRLRKDPIAAGAPLGRRATIHDVARAAGVSPRTVTRVLLGQPHVRPEVLQRTDAAIRSLGYAPDSLAQGLAQGRSSLVGMVYENPNPSYIIDVQEGLLAGLQAHGLELVVRRGEQDSPEFLGDVAAFVQRLKLVGMVLTPPLSDDARIIDLLVSIGCPYVRLAARALDTPDRMVVGDDWIGAQQVGRHLVGLGHRRIATICGPANFLSAAERLSGLEKGLAEGGVTLSTNMIARGGYTYESGIACAAQLLALSPRPTAIFAGNDEMAAGVLQAAQRRGLRVPEDLTVIGFDDLEIARTSWPPLTSVRMPTREFGRLAAEKLSVAAGRRSALEQIERPPAPFLVVRASCGPVAAQDLAAG
jgi:LacI family transcriptional regulator